MRIVFKAVGKPCRVIDIKDELGVFQHLVGGYIEPAPIGEGVIALVDEEGVLKGKRPNVQTRYHTLVGDIVFVGCDDDGFTGLTDEQINHCVFTCEFGRIR